MNIRGSTRPILLAAGALAVVVIGAAAAGVNLTSRPGFCASCHEMQPPHNQWQRGSHTAVKCDGCHVDPTFRGVLAAKVNGVRQVYVHFTRNVDLAKVQAHVPAQRCVRCHDPSDAFKVGPRIATAHTKHGEAKIECTVCHQTTGHSRQRFVGYTLKSCDECHSRARNRGGDFHLRAVACQRSAD